MATLTADRLAKRLGHRTILRDVSFELGGGQCVALFGANGAGKSTLLTVLATLAAPSDGRLLWNGEDLSSARDAYRRRVGYVSHQALLYPDWSGRRNLRFFAALHGVDRPNDRADELLEDVNLSAFADEPARIYSRGMLQRLSIARALVHSPEVLLLDEVFTGLDAAMVSRVSARIEAERAAGAVVLLVTHDAEAGHRLATECWFLRNGGIEAIGKPPVNELRARFEKLSVP
ncbi:heme ABC exporter ATP-binding protein CcmA [Candidatus Poribacteria bacterium]|nr:heme ABC exporter ATP-binding protein CcmA [Candidatus Poribacteria bacterium]